MIDSADGFLGGLRLEEIDPRSTGLVAAHAILAAGATVDTRHRLAHSVHLAHLSEQPPDGPVALNVECLRDDEHLSTRRVVASCGRIPLLSATVSFQLALPGRAPRYQRVQPSAAPDPHGLPGGPGAAGVPIDVRCLEPGRHWVRITEELPDLILPHLAALVFAADLLLVDPGAQRHEWTAGRAVDLDLSVRVHQTFRADDWLLHECGFPSAADHRTFGTGRFYSPLGRLVASVSRETALVPFIQRRGNDVPSRGHRGQERQAVPPVLHGGDGLHAEEGGQAADPGRRLDQAHLL